MSYNRPRPGALPARGRGSANGARPDRRRSRPLEVNMAGRVRANSAGPRLPFHSYEGSERARWDEEHLVDHAKPHDGTHRTDESGRPGAGEKAEPGRDRAGRPGRLHLRTGPLGHFCVSAHQRLARPRDPDQLAAGACSGTGLSRWAARAVHLIKFKDSLWPGAVRFAAQLTERGIGCSRTWRLPPEACSRCERPAIAGC
jgi:hypothetical protein